MTHSACEWSREVTVIILAPLGMLGTGTLADRRGRHGGAGRGGGGRTCLVIQAPLSDSDFWDSNDINAAAEAEWHHRGLRVSPGGNLITAEYECGDYIKMGDMGAPQKVTPNYLYHPLVAGSGIGHKPCLLHYLSKDLGQTKSSNSAFSWLWFPCLLLNQPECSH